jgi:hypothetical protein
LAVDGNLPALLDRCFLAMMMADYSAVYLIYPPVSTRVRYGVNFLPAHKSSFNS